MSEKRASASVSSSHVQRAGAFAVRVTTECTFCLTDFSLDFRITKFKVFGTGKSDKVRGNALAFTDNSSQTIRLRMPYCFDIFAQVQRICLTAAAFDFNLFFTFGNSFTLNIGDCPG